MYKLLRLAGVLVVACIFCYRATVFLDPDFGWHFAMGKLLTTSGIPRSDPFSYTMQSYPFVDHEWLTNRVIYYLYTTVGTAGLAILFTSLALFTLVLSVRGNLLLFTLTSAAIIPFFGTRPQVQSWLYLAAIFLLIRRQTLWHRFRFLVPIFMLFWANMHGSFAIGLATLWIYILIKSLRMKRLNLSDMVVVLVSTTATLVNPYGLALWRESWMQFTDTNLRWSVMEWMPAFFSFNFPFLAVVALSVVFIWKYRAKINLEDKVLYGVFLFQASSSVRHIPLFLVIATPLILTALKYFEAELGKIKFGLVRYNKIGKFALAGGILIFGIQTFSAVRGAVGLSESSFYPQGAVSYLEQNGICGRLFNDYGWGGYLTWKMPSERLFIDGRMPSFRWNASLPGQSNWVMKEYTGVLTGGVGFDKVFPKYNVGTVLLPVDKPDSLYIRLTSKLERFFTETEPYKLKDELAKNSWAEVYKDNIAVIFKRFDCPLGI